MNDQITAPNTDRIENEQNPNAMQTSTTSSGEVGYNYQIIYGGNSIAGSDLNESRIMSDKTRVMADAIYKEFEGMIQKFGSESVKELMPLVVHVLETLDFSLLEKEEAAVDLEILKEENEQLLNQYERERQTRKNQDQKYLELEENLTEQNRTLETKVNSLESIVKILELRAKNASDHAVRLEEREEEHKMEYEKLHERYNELLRTHIDHVERTKFLIGTEVFEMANILPKKTDGANMVSSAVAGSARGITDIIGAAHMSQSVCPGVNLANHITEERDWTEEFGMEDASEILSSARRTETIAAQDVEEAEVSGKSMEKRNPLLAVNEEGVDTDTISLTGHLVDPREFASSVNDTFLGMGREVENLIRENTDLLETKNALNIVKNDLIARLDQLTSEKEVFKEEVISLELVRNKLNERLRELEAELKEMREKNAELQNKIQSDEETSLNPDEDIPTGQRKRFTRVEMARVLMERNQFKEKFMELQETMRFTENQRAQKMRTQQNKGGIWQFFSGLFTDNNASSNANIRRHSKTDGIKDVNSGHKSSNRRQNRNLDLDIDLVHERRMQERRQQYNVVSQHIKKEDKTRIDAYGWLIPATIDITSSTSSFPVPVCCRPLLDRKPSLKIWCATSAKLHGGVKDNRFMVSDSLIGCDPDVLLSDDNSQDSNKKLSMSKEWSSLQESCSLVWVGSSNERQSFVTILDANNPNVVVDSFAICSSHLLCIGSVPGAKPSDICAENSMIVPSASDSEIQDFFTKFAMENCVPNESIPEDLAKDRELLGIVKFVRIRRSEVEDGVPTYCSQDDQKSPRRARDFSINKDEDNPEDQGEESLPSTSASTCSHLSLHIRETLSRYEQVANGHVSTAFPTMWMGLENDYIYVHSAILEWRKCLLRVKMPDAVLHIVHTHSRVFAALANGTIAVFHRSSDGCWSEYGYNQIHLGRATSSVCHLAVVNGSKLWAAYRNCIVVVNPVTLRTEHAFSCHPRSDSQVRQILPIGAGVWVSIRLDSTIRLYHQETYQHLQDLEIEPFITKMLGTNKLDFLHLRITSLSSLNKRLWIGTGSGIIVSIPLNESIVKIPTTKGSNKKTRAPGGLIRVHWTDEQQQADGSQQQTQNKEQAKSDTVEQIPYCSMANAQLSFHGHRDAVRFLLPVLSEGISSLTRSLETRKALMISGGDGYIDFRQGEINDEKSPEDAREKPIRVRDMSHLLLWECECSISPDVQ